MAAKKLEKPVLETEERQPMKECTICHGALTKPEALQCLHFCCKICIEDMILEAEGNRSGYRCPLCRKFTAREDVKPWHFMDEIIGAGNGEQRPCDKCKTEIPMWRCTDCKENYCVGCRKHHDEFSLLRNHTCDSLADKKYPLIDKHIFCSEHSSKLIELHCKTCNRLICMLCNGTDHKNHDAETIDKALKNAKPVVQENAEKLGNLMKTTEGALVESNTHLTNMIKEYKQLEAQIDRAHKEVLRKAEADYENVTEHFNVLRRNQLREAEDYIRQLEIVLHSQRNIAELSDTTMSSAQGTSLLHAIQTGLREGLVTYVQNYTQPAAYTDGLSAKFAQASPSKDNLIGSIVELATGRHSMQVPRALFDVNEFHGTLSTEITIPFASVRFAKISNQFWFTGLDSNKIHVCTTEGKLIKSLEFSNITNCRSVAQAGQDVIIAADSGLFIIDNGIENRELLKGEFSDVCVKGNTIFALNGCGKVNVLKNSYDERNGYSKQTTFDIANYNKHNRNTIQITNDHVYIAQYEAMNILQYHHNGEHVASRGSQGNEDDNIQHPSLSGADSGGILLVADTDNNRLQTLTPTGTWKPIKQEKLTPRPSCCVFIENKFFVLGGDANNTFQIFALE